MDSWSLMMPVRGVESDPARRCGKMILPHLDVRLLVWYTGTVVSRMEPYVTPIVPKPERVTKKHKRKERGKPHLGTKRKDRPEKEEGKRRYKYHPGTQARRAVRAQQKSTKSLVPFALFARMVRTSTPPLMETRWNRRALVILREAMETYLVEQANTANMVMLCNDTRTLKKSDLELVAAIRRRAGRTL